MLGKCVDQDWRCSWQPFRGNDTAYALASAARIVLETGNLPNIKRFDIVGILGHPAEPSTWNRELGIVHRALITERSRVYPIIPDDSRIWIRYQETPDSKILEKCSVFEHLAVELEGGGGWATTSLGSRHPQVYKENATGAYQDHIWQPMPDINSIPYTITHWNPAPTLWRWEQEAGRLLLLPRFIDSIGRLEVLERELCEAERKGVRLSDYAMIIEYPEAAGADLTDDSFTGESAGDQSGLS